jgi:hypothetical protein
VEDGLSATGGLLSPTLPAGDPTLFFRRHQMEAHEIGRPGSHLRPCYYAQHIPRFYLAAAHPFLFRGTQHFFRGERALAQYRLYPP